MTPVVLITRILQVGLFRRQPTVVKRKTRKWDGSILFISSSFFDKLGAVTIEAIKEQQKEIEELKSLLKETSRRQQKEIELLKAEKKQEAIYP